MILSSPVWKAKKNSIIFQINNFELMNLPQLKELRLHGNNLNQIHPMAFMNVPQLQYLYMRDNLIGSLDGNRLQAFHKLEILDVTNNLLQKVCSWVYAVVFLF